MESFRLKFYQNIDIPNTLLLKLRERKAKIRKFMLYVNGVLNDTEQEISMMCELFSQLEKLLQESPTDRSQLVPKSHNKSKRRVKFTERISTKNKSCNDAVVEPETAPSGVEDTSCAEMDFVVPETCAANDSLHLSPPESTIDCPPDDSQCNVAIKSESIDATKSSTPDDDETVGVLAEDNSLTLQINSNDQPDVPSCNADDQEVSKQSYSIDVHQVTSQSLPSCSDEQQESLLLSPVTKLVNNVLASKPKRVDRNSRKHFRHRWASSNSSLSSNKPQRNEKQNTKAVALTDSPVQFVDCLNNERSEEDETVFDDIAELPMTRNDSSDIAQLPSQSYKSSQNLVNKKIKKTVTCWPIGYSKPSAKGQLVVEPAPSGCRRKRTRQTRLDGFLAKAALQSSMDRSNHQPLIAMKSIGSRRSINTFSSQISAHQVTSSALSVVSDSESDDLCDIDVNVLQAHAKKPSANSDVTSPKVKQELSPDCDRLPEKKFKYQIGEVVRGRARKQLTGYRCTQCYEYYRTLNLSEEEIQQRLNMVCRHRAVKPPMETPPNFWNMSIASLETNQQ